MKKEFVFLLIGIMLFTVIFVSFVLFSAPQTNVTPSPSETSSLPSRLPIVSVRPEYSPPKQEDLPYLPENRGGGIDKQSEAVKNSTEEINKLRPEIPYQKYLTLTNGQRVEILIPAADLQFNAWTLTVQIFDIDYQVEKNTDEYQIMKDSFLESANTVFSWMRSKGANPNNIIISWGDRAFIQARAEEWLVQ